MENVYLLIQMTVIGGAVVIAMLLLTNFDRSITPRYAKVRLRVEGWRRRHNPEPREEKEYDMADETRLMLGGIAAFIFMVVMMMSL